MSLLLLAVPFYRFLNYKPQSPFLPCRLNTRRSPLAAVTSFPFATSLLRLPLHFTWPATIYEDNSAYLSQANLPKMTPRTKHIAVSYHWFREYVLSGVLRILKIDTAVNPADIFTKGLVAEKFTAIRKLVCGW